MVNGEVASGMQPEGDCLLMRFSLQQQLTSGSLQCELIASCCPDWLEGFALSLGAIVSNFQH